MASTARPGFDKSVSSLWTFVNMYEDTASASLLEALLLRDYAWEAANDKLADWHLLHSRATHKEALQ